MRREISGKRIRDFVQMIKRRYPEICLRTTLLLGFPGETEQEFEELLEFVKEMEFDRLGAFSYSREYGTESYTMGFEVPDEVKESRISEIMQAQAQISLLKNRSFIGKTIPVIVDARIEKGCFDGRSEFDAPEIDNGVLVRGKGALVGKIVPVMITDAVEYDLMGHVVQERRIH
jgi:ribosomal protein S12 methylthiotransferase